MHQGLNLAAVIGVLILCFYLMSIGQGGAASVGFLVGLIFVFLRAVDNNDKAN